MRLVVTGEIFDSECFSLLNNKKLKGNVLFNFVSVRIPYLTWGERVHVKDEILFDAVIVTDLYCLIKTV